MSWTYDPTQLATNEIYQVRNEIADVDVNNQLLADEEIAWNISQERGFWSAAARSAEQISRLLLRKADVRLGRSMQITYTRAAEQYLMMAKALRCKALGTTPPFVGGMSVSDKIAYSENGDLVAPLFEKTMQQSPWTGGYTSDSLPPVGNEGDTASGDFDEDDF
jgi:hypothetical protein